jgi:hypothetical protein
VEAIKAHKTAAQIAQMFGVHLPRLGAGTSRRWPACPTRRLLLWGEGPGGVVPHPKRSSPEAASPGSDEPSILKRSEIELTRFNPKN